MGYTANGFYAKQRPGEKRFVISPNTLLVYEVEVLDIKKGDMIPIYYFCREIGE